MIYIPDIATGALAIYIAYKIFKAWRNLADWRLTLYSLGMAILAASLLLEAVVEMYLANIWGEAPMRYVKRIEALLRAVIQLLSLAALVPIAVAVTPTLFYAVLPPAVLLGSINTVLALYIAAATLVKTFERGTPPFISLAFISYAVSLAAPSFSFLDVAARLLTAVFLALGVAYGSEKEK
ncbi:MAG: hypothetical protein ACP5J0_01185 [Pyrobaculum sp.]